MTERELSPIAKAMLDALDRGDVAEFMRLRDAAPTAKDAVNDPKVGTTFHFAPEKDDER